MTVVINGVLQTIDTSAVHGSSTIAAAGTYVDITHSLGKIPTNVILAPSDDVSGRNYWADTIGAVTFRANISSADVVNHIFYWTVW